MAYLEGHTTPTYLDQQTVVDIDAQGFETLRLSGTHALVQIVTGSESIQSRRVVDSLSHQYPGRVFRMDSTNRPALLPPTSQATAYIQILPSGGVRVVVTEEKDLKK